MEKGKNVLVTGGCGFIGSHLVEALLKKDYKVRVIDNLSFGNRSWIPDHVEFIKGDITRLDDCLLACKDMDGVFHMAAMSRAGPSIEAVDFCTQQNVIGTQNILIASRDAGVKKIIYSGSSTYYGNRPGPHCENTPSDFLNFYALSKAVGEQYCLTFDKLFGLESTVLRYFNVYGPRQPQTGAYALVLGIFLRRKLEGKHLEIHGKGDQRRDFIHVTDVAEANIAAYQAISHGKIYNVGSGKNISVKELANLISEDQIHVERRAGDAEVTLADLQNTQRDLNWAPKVDFLDRLNEMIDLKEMI